eukprot:Nk52_evm32s234 gene=Nk52_evmTU32s234
MSSASSSTMSKATVAAAAVTASAATAAVAGDVVLSGEKNKDDSLAASFRRIFHVDVLPRPVLITLLSGGSCSIASIILNPFDVTKVRLQNQVLVGAKPAPGMSVYRNFPHALSTIVREEGLRGISRGMTATVMREMSYSSIRLGTYEPIRNFISGGQEAKDTGILNKLGAGLIAGTLGSCITNPTDVVKTRFQINRTTVPPFRNTFVAFYDIAQAEGFFRGLWRGVGPTVTRAALISCAQIGSYDAIKNNLLINQFGVQDGIGLHFASSMLAGLITTAVTTPPDTIKTRVMADGHAKYKGAIDCLMKTVRREGVVSLWKGFLPAWLRIGPHTVISFLLIEKLRPLVGLNTI